VLGKTLSEESDYDKSRMMNGTILLMNKRFAVKSLEKRQRAGPSSHREVSRDGSQMHDPRSRKEEAILPAQLAA